MNYKDVLPARAGRRQFLSTVAGTLVSSCLPSLAQSAAGSELHLVAADHAKQLSRQDTNTLSLLMPEGCGDNVAPVIASFREATGITVNTTETAVDDINTQLLLDTMSDSGGYDLALPATFGLPDLVAAHAIIPVSDFAKKYEPEGFRQGVLYDTGDSFDGDIYGFQADGDAYLMFYNKEFLEDPVEKDNYADRFGTALAIPETWQELDQQMAFFNRESEGKFGGLLFRTAGYLAWEWWVRFHAKGYWPLSESLEPQIHSDAGVEALEEMIRASQHLAPETKTLGLFANWERYSRGDVYCNIGWGGSQKYLNGENSAMRGKMSYGPTPGGNVDGKLLLTPYFNWGWNYVVTATSNAPELAYLFALFASSPAMSLTSVQQQGGYFDPFRPEHYEDPEIQRIYSRDFLKVHEQSLRSSIPDLYIANQGQYAQTLNSWLERALAGSVSPDEALNRVAQHWSLLNDRSDKQLQKERWLKLREKYPEAVRRQLRDVA